MIRWNKQTKMSINTRLVMGEKEKLIFRHKNIENFLQKIENAEEGENKTEMCLVRLCLQDGKKVILTENGEIHLYFSLDSWLKKEKVIIEKNEELYSLLKDLFES